MVKDAFDTYRPFQDSRCDSRDTTTLLWSQSTASFARNLSFDIRRSVASPSLFDFCIRASTAITKSWASRVTRCYCALIATLRSQQRYYVRKNSSRFIVCLPATLFSVPRKGTHTPRALINRPQQARKYPLSFSLQLSVSHSNMYAQKRRGIDQLDYILQAEP